MEAFVNETLRFSSMIVMNVQRTATRDTTIQDYNIPKVSHRLVESKCLPNTKNEESDLTPISEIRASFKTLDKWIIKHKFNVSLLKWLTNDVLQGTVVSVCNYSCHFDPKYWTEPLKFNPERFLGEDGKFQAPKSGFFAFGQGNFTLSNEDTIGSW